MRAARIHEYGDADVIRCEEIPRPAPGPREVLIKVAASSFNPADIGLRSGALRDVLHIDLPLTLGIDVSGTITAVGSDVDTHAVGERVIARLDRGGAMAEYVVAAADFVVQAPTTIPLTTAAVIPAAALTAWQALFDHANITPSQRVLVNGAGGGVGVFTIQLVKHAGATVIATASRRSAAAVRKYGADQIIDYTITPVPSAVDVPVDAVVNLAAITAEAAEGLVSLVRPGGVLVSITVPVHAAADTGVAAIHMVARNDVDHLARIVELVDAGMLIVEATETHPLRDVALVHRRSESGTTSGKILIVP